MSEKPRWPRWRETAREPIPDRTEVLAYWPDAQIGEFRMGVWSHWMSMNVPPFWMPLPKPPINVQTKIGA